MLTLERKTGEAVSITHKGETLDVIVSDIRGGSIKLSFDGPLSFAVIRDDAKEVRHDV